MPQSINNVLISICNSVSLSKGLNELELVAKLGDPIECLKHNGHSLAQGYSMVGIKVSFVDIVDMV